MKKLFFTLLTLILLLGGMTASARAATAGEELAAQTLYELKLFRGTGVNADGSPIFSLDRTPTRNQAIIMLVRLLGKEAEAQSGNWDIPFTDVSDSMRPYVGYAYAHRLTGGTTATTFSGSAPVRANQYITFVLRALGYESGKDFQVSTAWTLSDRLGITAGQYRAGTTFTRGGVADISWAALAATLKGTEQCLAEKLRADGAIAKDARVLYRQSGVPEGLTFQTYPSELLQLWGSPLKSFTLNRLEYAGDGDSVYLRLHFSDPNGIQKFFVMPANYIHGGASGAFLRYAAEPNGNVFVFRLPKSLFESYSELILSPSEDGKSGPCDYVIQIGYMQLTKDDRAPLFHATTDWQASEETQAVKDFRLLSVEYAEVVGGRMYRLNIENGVDRLVRFWPAGSSYQRGAKESTLRIVHPKAGDTGILCFVPNYLLTEGESVTVQVLDSANGMGGKQQSFAIYLHGLPR